MAGILLPDGVIQLGSEKLLYPGGVVQITAGTAYTLTADAGSYTLTGQSATFTFARALSADAGAYTFTGQDAQFVYNQAVAEIISTGGLPPQKAKSNIKKSQRNEIEAIVKQQFDALEYVAPPEVVKEVKQKARQEIKRIDLTEYDQAIARVYAIMAVATAQLQAYETKRLEDEMDDEETLLMLM